eukprot:SAG11_NODE_30007_length_305_cov_0.733010_1_plen_20_part_10
MFVSNLGRWMLRSVVRVAPR